MVGPPVDAESWVSGVGTATHLGVARNSVYRWIEKKGLPAHKMGRPWKFKVAGVDEWVRAGGEGAAGNDVAGSSRHLPEKS